MKKRLAALVLATATACSLVGCGSTEATGSAATAAAADSTAAAAETATQETTTAATTEAAEAAEPVEITVTTTFAGEDGNAQNYKDAVAAWETRQEIQSATCLPLQMKH